MGLIDLASGNSLWRGYDYFEAKKVSSYQKQSEVEYSGIVKGTYDYNVFINIEHPRKSTCNCPHADGRRVICKHMVALYFTVYPQEAQKLLDEAQLYEEELEHVKEKMIEEKQKEIKTYVYSLSKSELRERLISELMLQVYQSLEDDRW